jgi:hypothetical protein
MPIAFLANQFQTWLAPVRLKSHQRPTSAQDVDEKVSVIAEPKAGHEAFYSEDGWVAKVAVLQDNSNDKVLSYALRVIDTIQTAPGRHHPSKGQIFTALQKRGYRYWGMWRLSVDY